MVSQWIDGKIFFASPHLGENKMGYGEWINVDDALPEIPKGKYGISVLVAEFDEVYKEISGGDGYDVHQVTYGYTQGHKWFKDLGIELEKDFMTMYIGGEEGPSYGPTGDVVTHWMYLPLPPKRRE